MHCENRIRPLEPSKNVISQSLIFRIVCCLAFVWVCSFMFCFECSADSIVIGDTVHENVYITETAKLYYVRIPSKGTVTGSLKSKVTDVTITKNKGDRKALLTEWRSKRAHRPERFVQVAGPLPPPGWRYIKYEEVVEWPEDLIKLLKKQNAEHEERLRKMLEASRKLPIRGTYSPIPPALENSNPEYHSNYDYSSFPNNNYNRDNFYSQQTYYPQVNYSPQYIYQEPHNFRLLNQAYAPVKIYPQYNPYVANNYNVGYQSYPAQRMGQVTRMVPRRSRNSQIRRAPT